MLLFARMASYYSRLNCCFCSVIIKVRSSFWLMCVNAHAHFWGTGVCVCVRALGGGGVIFLFIQDLSRTKDIASDSYTNNTGSFHGSDYKTQTIPAPFTASNLCISRLPSFSHCKALPSYGGRG